MSQLVNHKGVKLFPIGIGTWGIGGFANANPNNDDERQIEALSYMLNMGMNFIEANVWTSEGRSLDLLSKAIKKSKVNRSKLFITQTIYTHSAPTLADAENELIAFRSKLEIDAVDSLQISVMSFEKYGEVNLTKFLHKALDSGFTKFISITNANILYLNKIYREFSGQLFAHEIGLNFEIRENTDNGVIDWASERDILNVVYQPLRRNRTLLRDWPLLRELAYKYSKTQNQIILNWLVTLGMLPITKSENIEHIDQYLDSLTFKMEKTDILKISEFRPPHYHSPKAFYGSSGEGIRIDQLSNVFDEEYDKQNKL
ncbi:MAG TPA: aldo/keto reductase [Candidatus Dojkabacteria bacterium]|nr:aldo/keto reductase [Candidatus Dojkabacteria bacterium]